MTTAQWCLGAIILLTIVTGILLVIFGQITVRKLRRIANKKNMLGVEFVSGWDILNVAGALSTPKWLREKFISSGLSGLTANYEFVYGNTNKLDRFIARIFWFFYLISGISTIIYTVFSMLGMTN